MFGSKKKQNIFITQHDKQLKINYTILQNNKIEKEESSAFLITDKTMPQDAIFKLDTLQKDIPHSYLATLFEGEEQRVIPTEIIDIITDEAIALDTTKSIVIPKNNIIQTSKYFINTGIDYIFSPFSILNEYIQEAGIKNSLNVLLLNNKIYTILLGNSNEIIRADIKELTPYEQIKDEEFSTDESIDQKLYEEVHFLEIQQFLNDIVQEYYSAHDDVEFLEQIKLLYTSQPFTQVQLDSLYETIMVTIEHEEIEIKQYISKLLQTQKQSSFIVPRVKKDKKNTLSWVFLLILSMIAVALVLYFNMSEPEIEEVTNSMKSQSMQSEQPVEVQAALEKIEQQTILPKLPDHMTSNYNLRQRVSMLFDIIPYDGLLKDLEILKDNSTFVVNFAMPTNSPNEMQTKLKNIYKDSKILLKHQNKALLNTIIENTNITTSENNITNKEYPKLNLMSLTKATDYIQAIAPKGSSLKLDTKEKTTFETYKFKVVSNLNDPNEFFKFIDKLSKQQSSITIEYPVIFSKLKNTVEVRYNLHLHQELLTQPSPKK